MAINKNFVVKNGLEVDTNTLFVDSVNNRVAIGTTSPTVTLDVRGKIQSNSEIETVNARVTGIVTAGAVGVTTLTALDAVVTGFSTLGLANATSLKVTTGFTTVQSLSSVDLTVSIGATISKDLNVGAAATVGAALTVTGASKFAEFVRFEKDVAVGSAVTVGAALTVTGASKFAEFARFEKDVAVGSAATVGVLTVTNNVYIGGNLVVGGDIDLDEFNGRNLRITGIATVGFITASNLFVTGVTTTSTLHVGLGGTILTAIGIGNSQRVGIGTTAAFVLDVLGDINSSTAIRVGGVDILTTASGDATALAIALG